MSIENFEEIKQLESKKFTYQNEVNEKIQHLSKSGVNFKDLARILGISELSKYNEQSQITSLDENLFVSDESEKESVIHLPAKFTKLNQFSNREVNEESEDRIARRSNSAAEVLAELGVDYNLIDGTNDPDQLDYNVFVIPALKKAVFVNNRGENGSYVLHNVMTGEVGLEELLDNTLAEYKKSGGNKATFLHSSNREEWKLETKAALAV